MNDTELESMVIRLLGDGSSYVQMLRDAQTASTTAANVIEAQAKKIEEMKDHVIGFGQAALTALTAFGAKNFLTSAFDMFKGSETVMLRLQAAIQSSGNAIPETLAKYTEFAASLRDTTGASKDATFALLQAAETRGISGDAAMRAVKVATELAAALGGEAQHYLMVNQALETNNTHMLHGLPGVRMMHGEQEKLAYAQRLVANATGVAASMMGSTEGIMKRYSNAVTLLTKQFGELVARAVTPMVEWLTKLVQKFTDLDPALKKVIVYAALFAAGILTIGPAIAAVNNYAVPLFALMMKGFALAKVGVLALLNPLTMLSLVFSTTGAIMSAVFSPFGLLILAASAAIGVFIDRVGGLQAAWEKVKEYSAAAWEWARVKTTAFVEWVTPYVYEGLDALKSVWAIIRQKGGEVWDWIKAKFQAFVVWVSPYAEWMRAKFLEAWDWIRTDGVVLWGKIKEAAATFFGWVDYALVVFTGAFGLAWLAVEEYAVPVFEMVKQFAEETFGEVQRWASIGTTAVTEFVAANEDLILSFVAIAGAIGVAYGAYRLLIAGYAAVIAVATYFKLQQLAGIVLWSAWKVAILTATVATATYSAMYAAMLYLLGVGNAVLTSGALVTGIWTAFAVAAKIAVWLWNAAIAIAIGIMGLYNAGYTALTGLMTLHNFLSVASSAATGAWAVVVLIAKGAMWLLNAALTYGVSVIGALPLVIAAAIATVLVLAGAFAGVGLAVTAVAAVVYSGAMSIVEAITLTIGAFRNLSADTTPLEAITKIFGEWWEILKNVIRATQTDLPLAWNLLKAGATLAVLQIKALWPPLWDYIKEAGGAAWDILAIKFRQAWDRILPQITIKVIDFLSGISSKFKDFILDIAWKATPIGFADMITSDVADLITGNRARIANQAAADEVRRNTELARNQANEILAAEKRLTNLHFRMPVDTSEIIAARAEVARLTALIRNPATYTVDLELNLRRAQDELARLQRQGEGAGGGFAAGAEKGEHKFEAVLRDSAEAITRIAHYQDMLNDQSWRVRTGTIAAPSLPAPPPLPAVVPGAAPAQPVPNIPAPQVGQPQVPNVQVQVDVLLANMNRLNAQLERLQNIQLNLQLEPVTFARVQEQLRLLGVVRVEVILGAVPDQLRNLALTLTDVLTIQERVLEIYDVVDQNTTIAGAVSGAAAFFLPGPRNVTVNLIAGALTVPEGLTAEVWFIIANLDVLERRLSMLHPTVTATLAPFAPMTAMTGTVFFGIGNLDRLRDRLSQLNVTVTATIQLSTVPPTWIGPSLWVPTVLSPPPIPYWTLRFDTETVPTMLTPPPVVYWNLTVPAVAINTVLVQPTSLTPQTFDAWPIPTILTPPPIVYWNLTVPAVAIPTMYTAPAGLVLSFDPVAIMTAYAYPQPINVGIEPVTIAVSYSALPLLDVPPAVLTISVVFGELPVVTAIEVQARVDFLLIDLPTITLTITTTLSAPAPLQPQTVAAWMIPTQLVSPVPITLTLPAVSILTKYIEPAALTLVVDTMKILTAYAGPQPINTTAGSAVIDVSYSALPLLAVPTFSLTASTIAPTLGAVQSTAVVIATVENLTQPAQLPLVTQGVVSWLDIAPQVTSIPPAMPTLAEAASIHWTFDKVSSVTSPSIEGSITWVVAPVTVQLVPSTTAVIESVWLPTPSASPILGSIALAGLTIPTPPALLPIQGSAFVDWQPVKAPSVEAVNIVGSVLWLPTSVGTATVEGVSAVASLAWDNNPAPILEAAEQVVNRKWNDTVMSAPVSPEASATWMVTVPSLPLLPSVVVNVDWSRIPPSPVVQQIPESMVHAEWQPISEPPVVLELSTDIATSWLPAGQPALPNAPDVQPVISWLPALRPSVPALADVWIAADWLPVARPIIPSMSNVVCAVEWSPVARPALPAFAATVTVVWLPITIPVVPTIAVMALPAQSPSATVPIAPSVLGQQITIAQPANTPTIAAVSALASVSWLPMTSPVPALTLGPILQGVQRAATWTSAEIPMMPILQDSKAAATWSPAPAPSIEVVDVQASVVFGPINVPILPTIQATSVSVLWNVGGFVIPTVDGAAILVSWSTIAPPAMQSPASITTAANIAIQPPAVPQITAPSMTGIVDWHNSSLPTLPSPALIDAKVGVSIHPFVVPPTTASDASVSVEFISAMPLAQQDVGIDTYWLPIQQPTVPTIALAGIGLEWMAVPTVPQIQNVVTGLEWLPVLQTPAIPVTASQIISTWLPFVATAFVGGTSAMATLFWNRNPAPLLNAVEQPVEWTIPPLAMPMPPPSFIEVEADVSVAELSIPLMSAPGIETSILTSWLPFASAAAVEGLNVLASTTWDNPAALLNAVDRVIEWVYAPLNVLGLTPVEESVETSVLTSWLPIAAATTIDGLNAVASLSWDNPAPLLTAVDQAVSWLVGPAPTLVMPGVEAQVEVGSAIVPPVTVPNAETNILASWLPFAGAAVVDGLNAVATMSWDQNPAPALALVDQFANVDWSFLAPQPLKLPDESMLFVESAITQPTGLGAMTLDEEAIATHLDLPDELVFAVNDVPIATEFVQPAIVDVPGLAAAVLTEYAQPATIEVPELFVLACVTYELSTEPSLPGAVVTVTIALPTIPQLASSAVVDVMYQESPGIALYGLPPQEIGTEHSLPAGVDTSAPVVVISSMLTEPMLPDVPTLVGDVKMTPPAPITLLEQSSAVFTWMQQPAAIALAALDDIIQTSLAAPGPVNLPSAEIGTWLGAPQPIFVALPNEGIATYIEEPEPVTVLQLPTSPIFTWMEQPAVIALGAISEAIDTALTMPPNINLSLPFAEIGTWLSTPAPVVVPAISTEVEQLTRTTHATQTSQENLQESVEVQSRQVRESFDSARLEKVILDSINRSENVVSNAELSVGQRRTEHKLVTSIEQSSRSAYATTISQENLQTTAQVQSRSAVESITETQRRTKFSTVVATSTERTARFVEVSAVIGQPLPIVVPDLATVVSASYELPFATLRLPTFQDRVSAVWSTLPQPLTAPTLMTNVDAEWLPIVGGAAPSLAATISENWQAIPALPALPIIITRVEWVVSSLTLPTVMLTVQVHYAVPSLPLAAASSVLLPTTAVAAPAAVAGATALPQDVASTYETVERLTSTVNSENVATMQSYDVQSGYEAERIVTTGNRATTATTRSYEEELVFGSGLGRSPLVETVSVIGSSTTVVQALTLEHLLENTYRTTAGGAPRFVPYRHFQGPPIEVVPAAGSPAEIVQSLLLSPVLNQPLTWPTAGLGRSPPQEPPAGTLAAIALSTVSEQAAVYLNNQPIVFGPGLGRSPPRELVLPVGNAAELLQSLLVERLVLEQERQSLFPAVTGLGRSAPNQSPKLKLPELFPPIAGLGRSPPREVSAVVTTTELVETVMREKLVNNLLSFLVNVEQTEAGLVTWLPTVQSVEKLAEPLTYVNVYAGEPAEGFTNEVESATSKEMIAVETSVGESNREVVRAIENIGKILTSDISKTLKGILDKPGLTLDGSGWT